MLADILEILEFGDQLKENVEFDKVFEIVAAAGANDVLQLEDGALEVITDGSSYHAVKIALEQADIKVEQSDTVWDAATKISLDLDTATRVMKIVSILEDLDDVQNVYTNADISADILAALD